MSWTSTDTEEVKTKSEKYAVEEHKCEERLSRLRDAQRALQNVQYHKVDADLTEMNETRALVVKSTIISDMDAYLTANP